MGRKRTPMRRWGGARAQELTAETLAVYGTRCHLCQEDGADTADHLVPRSAGGDDSIENRRPAHQACNSARGARSLADWFAGHPLPHRDPLPPSRVW